jgi:hypothetical protein
MALKGQLVVTNGRRGQTPLATMTLPPGLTSCPLRDELWANLRHRQLSPSVQKVTRTPTCPVRAPDALVIRPNSGELMLVFGLL